MLVSQDIWLIGNFGPQQPSSARHPVSARAIELRPSPSGARDLRPQSASAMSEETPVADLRPTPASATDLKPDSTRARDLRPRSVSATEE